MDKLLDSVSAEFQIPKRMLIGEPINSPIGKDIHFDDIQVADVISVYSHKTLEYLFSIICSNDDKYEKYFIYQNGRNFSCSKIIFNETRKDYAYRLHTRNQRVVVTVEND